MTEIKALEKMKAVLESCRRTEKLDPPFDTYWITVDACNACIEELEAEIAERFMELPCDADGVPILIGDVVAAQDEQPFKVRAFQYDVFGWFAIERLGSQWNVNQLHHVKPRTIEEVLRECAEAYASGADVDLGSTSTMFAKYADEIRELMGEGE